MTSRVIATAAAATLLALAGCNSAAPSAPAAVSATGPAADAALACHHYMVQRAWVRGLARPTAADALKFIGYVAADTALAQGTGKLHADLAAMAAAQRNDGPVYAASTRVYNDCAAIGITSG